MRVNSLWQKKENKTLNYTEIGSNISI
jgi:hypothetical protein